MRLPIKKLITDKITGEWGNESSDGKGCKILRTTNFTNIGIIDFENVVIRDIDEKKVTLKHLKFGDIIIEKSGGSPKQPVGRVVFFEVDNNEKYLCNNFTSILRPNSSKVIPKYLFYQLYQLHNRGKTLKYQNKTTGIINLKLDNYLEEEIEVPSLQAQLHIANILTKAESLIAQRKESIRLLDEYLKSVFLEMFGSDFYSNKKWKLDSFGNYIDTLTDYHANGSYESLREVVVLKKEPDFALMVRTTDLENKEFIIDCNYIDEHAYNFLEKSKVYGGEIIINKIGSAGKVYLMPFLNRPVSLGMNAFLLRFNNSLNNLYVYFLLTSIFGETEIQKRVKGAVTKTITKDAIRSIIIPIPPLELQTKFAQIVENTEALKAQYHQSLQELENLYGSLSQKAFKGELYLKDESLLMAAEPETKYGEK